MTTTKNSINLKGLIAPVVAVQVFNSGWSTVFNQGYTNSPNNVTVSSLTAGVYHVKVKFNNAQWQGICELNKDVTVGGAGAANNISTNTAGEDLMNQSSSKSIAVAPNPFINTVYLTIGSNKNETGIITIIDLEGKTLVKKSVSLQKGLNRLTIDELSKYRAGSYILRLTTSEGVQNMRLIKQ